jgi:hypothetical protein
LPGEAQIRSVQAESRTLVVDDDDRVKRVNENAELRRRLRRPTGWSYAVHQYAGCVEHEYAACVTLKDKEELTPGVDRGARRELLFRNDSQWKSERRDRVYHDPAVRTLR